jgi:hypothetical protein
MPQQFSNNARSTLTSSVTNSATSLTVDASAADLFPTANVGTGGLPSSGNWFKATIQDVSGNVEIIYVRTRNTGSAVFSNILRGQEGTTARSFTAGSVVGVRLTALDVQTAINILSGSNTFTGSNTFSVGISTGAWSFAESGGYLYFKHNGVSKMRLDSDGNAVVVGNVTAFGTIL